MKKLLANGEFSTIKAEIDQADSAFSDIIPVQSCYQEPQEIVHSRELLNLLEAWQSG